MKKRWILLILPLMMMVMPVASANGWGLARGLGAACVEHE